MRLRKLHYLLLFCVAGGTLAQNTDEELTSAYYRGWGGVSGQADGSVTVTTDCATKTWSETNWPGAIALHLEGLNCDSGDLRVSGLKAGAWYWTRTTPPVASALLPASWLQGEDANVPAGLDEVDRQDRGTYMELLGNAVIVPHIGGTLPRNVDDDLVSPYYRGWGGVSGQADGSVTVTTDCGTKTWSEGDWPGAIALHLERLHCDSGGLTVEGLKPGAWYWTRTAPPVASPLLPAAWLRGEPANVPGGLDEADAHARGTYMELLGNAVIVPHIGDSAQMPEESPYLRTTGLPTGEIEAGWRDGRFITHLSHAEGYWIVVMSEPETNRIEEQRLLSGSSFPRDEIDNAWDDGHHITEVSYGDGRWLVVMSRGTGFGRQSWFSSSSFPENQIREWEGDDLSITNLAYGDGRWLAVATEVGTYGDQAYGQFADLSEFRSFIANQWDDEDYRLTEVAFGDDMWAAVMTLTGHGWSQRWQSSGTFPANEVEANLNEDLRFLDLAYGDGRYVLVSTGGIDNVIGFSPPSLPSGGALDASVTSYTATSADFVVDLFVVDSASNLLPLEAADITIDTWTLSGGAEAQFTLNDSDLESQNHVGPYSATFLFDQSGSITSTDPADIRVEAAKVFLANLGSGDEVALLAFASGGNLPHSPVTAYNDETTGAAFTRDAHGFDGALRSLADNEGGGTPLYDAIQTAVTYTVNNSNNPNRAVIVFTDGDDTASSASLDDAVASANRRNVPLHTIALSSGVDLGVLAELAGATGGSLALASDAKRLVSYYGALGPYLSGTAQYYRTAWQVNLSGGTDRFRRGGWIRTSVAVNAPGGVIYIPFRLDFD